ncbi:MAG: B12-binding domain-containing radical SAM protein, partial [Nitrospirota bacterium]
VHFDDDTFGITKQYISDLCNGIMEHCRGLKWSCELHVRLVNEESISLMKKAGCYSIQIGVESGNNSILKEMRKNITIEEALSAARIIKGHGISLSAFFMVGFPQETEETLRDTVTAMKKIKCDSLLYSIFTPYPNTEIFDYCKERGLIKDDYDVSLYNHQSPANCFCMNIAPERFRTLVAKIEKMVDRKNAVNRIKHVFSLHALHKVRQLGLGESFKMGAKIFLGR